MMVAAKNDVPDWKKGRKVSVEMLVQSTVMDAVYLRSSKHPSERTQAEPQVCMDKK